MYTYWHFFSKINTKEERKTGNITNIHSIPFAVIVTSRYNDIRDSFIALRDSSQTSSKTTMRYKSINVTILFVKHTKPC